MGFYGGAPGNGGYTRIPPSPDQQREKAKQDRALADKLIDERIAAAQGMADVTTRYSFLQDVVNLGWDISPEANTRLSAARDQALRDLGKQAQDNDPFSAMIREAALAQLRGAQRRRRNTFVTGPRGLEGPMANAFMGGGTSLMGR